MPRRLIHRASSIRLGCSSVQFHAFCVEGQIREGPSLTISIRKRGTDVTDKQPKHGSTFPFNVSLLGYQIYLSYREGGRWNPVSRPSPIAFSLYSR